jgi:ABC-2 type transport system permease protein
MGYVRLGVILSAAFLLFKVPMFGSFSLLLAMIGVFIVANLSVGSTFSTIAKNQLQAMPMAFFFHPSIHPSIHVSFQSNARMGATGG